MPRSTPPTRFWATTTSARRSTAAKSTPKASRASRGFEGFGQGGRAHPGGFGPDAEFETFNFGPEGFTRGARRGRAGAAPGGGGFGGFEDILREAFGGAGGGRGRPGGAGFETEDMATGADVRAALTVTLPEAAHGVTQRVRLPTGKDVEVKIPAGIANGQTVRLRGQGMAGPGGTGDVLIAVTVARHPLFTLEGADVRLDLPMTLYEAVLGAKVRVPTLDRPVEITVPPGTSSGRTFRLKGKGFPAKEGHGDLLATVQIVLPERPDEELEALMKKWQTDKSLRSAQGHVSPELREGAWRLGGRWLIALMS